MHSVSSASGKKPTVAILVTLDTKECEGYYLKQRIEAHGGRGLLIDLSMRRYTPRLGKPDISNEEVAQASGMSIDEVSKLDRSKAQGVMVRGARKILKELLQRGELDAVVEQVLADNPQAVADVTAGGKKSKKARGFLLGQVMQKTKGSANPKVVSEILAGKLN